MKTIRTLTTMRELRRPVCLAIGFFDGLHCGHQQVLRRTIRRAHTSGGEAWAMTFDPHPLKVLHPSSAPPILTSTAHKLHLMERVGMDGCLLIPFTRRFASMPATVFLKRLGRAVPKLTDIFVGEDWKFGHSGSGDTSMLRTWARARGVRVTTIRLVRQRAGLVSSTRIRDAIARGRLGLASRLLGRPFSILGSVIRGNGIGRQLGFPTANLDAHNEVRPPVGVYAVYAVVKGRSYAGVVNFGRHPTVNPLSKPLIELHILDAKVRLYGCDVEIFFISRLRGERSFPSREALIEQIKLDVQVARQRLAARDAKKLWNKTLQAWHSDTIVPQKESRNRKSAERA